MNNDAKTNFPTDDRHANAALAAEIDGLTAIVHFHTGKAVVTRVHDAGFGAIIVNHFGKLGTQVNRLSRVHAIVVIDESDYRVLRAELAERYMGKVFTTVEVDAAIVAIEMGVR